jgi:hypothetical protein
LFSKWCSDLFGETIIHLNLILSFFAITILSSSFRYRSLFFCYRFSFSSSSLSHLILYKSLNIHKMSHCDTQYSFYLITIFLWSLCEYWKHKCTIIITRTINIITLQWFRLSIKFIEDEWLKLLKMNDQELLKINDSNYWRWMIKIIHEIIHKIYWRWMIQVIEDEWLKLSIRFIDDEWFKLLKMNDSNYWRWMIQIIEDEWLRLSIRFIEDEWFKSLKMNDWDYPCDLLNVNDSNHWRWMIKIIHMICCKMND